MTSRLDEVEASVDAVVDHLGPVDAVLLLEVGVEPRLDVVKNRLPSVRTASALNPRTLGGKQHAPVLVVDEVSVTRRVHHSQAKPHTVLLDICSFRNRSLATRLPAALSRSSAPAVMLSIETVLDRSWWGSGTVFFA